jgi:hypothetical protein
MAYLGASSLSLPDLRFVPVDSLVPHEQHDDHRLESLVQRLREQSMLKNPPVVAPLAPNGDHAVKYMILDGANRATAVRAAGLPHIVVQVVPYLDSGVQLSTWYHALAGFSRAELESSMRSIAGLEIGATGLMHARALLARRDALAFVAYGRGEACALHGGRDIMERNALLNQVVDIYRARRFYRVASDSVEETRARHEDVSAIVVFPHFEPAEILELATSGARLPAGITRHLIRWRALRLNIPLARLADDELSIEEKNAWLTAWLREKMNDRQVRFYEEPTVLFDE